MIKAEQAPWKYLITWSRYYYAIHFLKSGINYAVFGVIPDFSKAGAVGPYLHEMNVVGFYPFIKYLEVVLGSMLLFNILVPVALAFMAGIAFQIIYLNLFVSPHPRQLFTGTQELLLCGLLILSYGKIFTGLFQFKAKPGFPWQSGAQAAPVALAAEPATQAARIKDFVILACITVVWTLVVIGFSTSMGSRPLRMYDWGPPVGAFLLTLACMIVERSKLSGSSNSSVVKA